MNKKLSIITINYNNKEGLQKTINSVLNQTWKDFEYIVIDGGSTDGSEKIISHYKTLFSYCISEPDNGIYNAMNKGINVAKGDYLLFLNSGDELNDLTTLQTLEKFLDHKADIYYGNANYIENEGEIKRTYPEKLSFSFFMEQNLSHQASFIKRTLFHTFLYNENYKIVSDWEFFIYQICKQNVVYKYLDLTICKYDTAGISSNRENNKLMASERAQTIEKYFPLFIEDYNYIKTLKSKKVSQFVHLKKYPVPWAIVKTVMNLMLLFTPKEKIN